MSKKKKNRQRTQLIKVSKGLSRREACRRAGNRATRDWRGCIYNAKTGKVTLI